MGSFPQANKIFETTTQPQINYCINHLMSLLYDWSHPCSMNQDAFLYNTLAHDTTTPHGYQRAANVGTKSHQHKIKHRNRRNKHPWKSLKWVDMNRVKYPAAWISFGLHSLLCCLRFKGSIRPMSFHATKRPHDKALAAQRSGSGSSITCCQWHDAPTSWRFKDHLSIWTWGRHSLEVSSDPIFSSKFCQLEAAMWSVFGSELHTLLPCCLPLVRVQLQKLQVEVEVSSSKENKHTFLLESIDENWYF